MRIARIPKKSGGHRTLYIPTREEAGPMYLLLGPIEKRARKKAPEGVVHGFCHGRSPVTNAMAHVGHAYTVCFDIAEFFDSTGERHLTGLLNADEMKAVLVDGAPRQGLPTSPAVANLAATKLDHAIIKWRDKRKLSVVYTRYADDLALSCEDRPTADLILASIPEIVRRCGWRVNAKKTRVLDARQGRRRITGIAVGDDDVHPTRAMKRRLRAALHQRNKDEAQGLAAWCRCTPPRDRSRNEKRDGDLKSLCKAWKVRVDPNRIPDKGDDEWIDDETVITGDPVYLLGMSTWTTGWRTCLTHPGGQYHKSTEFWAYQPGTRLAAVLSDKTKQVAGVERRVMRARVLVHTLRDADHTRVYGHLYGCPDEIEALAERLWAHGVISMAAARERGLAGAKVVGNAPYRKLYLDSGTLKASRAQHRGHPVLVLSL